MALKELYQDSVRHFAKVRTETSPIMFPLGKIVKRQKIDVPWLQDICFLKTPRTGNRIRGHMKAYNSGLVKIYTNQDLNTCWLRFVAGKEMMHIFDDDNERVDSPEKLLKLWNEIQHNPMKRSDMVRSEFRTRWMVLAVFCPRPEREKVVQRARDGESEISIATDYRIPKEHVSSLTSDFYDDALAEFGLE